MNYIAAKLDTAHDVKVNAVKITPTNGVQLAGTALLAITAEQRYVKEHQSALDAHFVQSDLRSSGLNTPSKKSGSLPPSGKATERTKSGS